MKKSTIYLIAMLMCAWVSSFGQGNGLPQWKVVKEGQITNSCTQVGPATLLVPKKSGFYRFTAYTSLTTSMQSTGGSEIRMTWTDRTGNGAEVAGTFHLNSGPRWVSIGGQIFSPQPATAVSLTIFPLAPIPPDAICDTVFTIEKLTY